MEVKLDLTKEYGLVLEGGGARGAFQIGAWQALREAGIKIKGVAGVSVGALNGALIAMDDLELAQSLWQSIRYSRVMDVDDSLFEKLLKLDLKSLEFSQLVQDGKRLLKDKGLDVTPLKMLISQVVDEQRIRLSPCQLFITTFSLSDRKLLHLDAKSLPEGAIGDMLLASSYLPVFKSEKLAGKLYADGGGFNNVPLDVLIDRGYEHIIVIRVYGFGLDRERKVVIPDGTEVYRIAPAEALGKLLEFDSKKSKKNMLLGYLCGQKLIYGLWGRHYFIEAALEEADCLNRLLSDTALLNLYGDLSGFDFGEWPVSGYRRWTEILFPKMAKRLKLKTGWNYKDLYLALVEDLAIALQINRYRIYRVEDLVKKIHASQKKV